MFYQQRFYEMTKVLITQEIFLVEVSELTYENLLAKINHTSTAPEIQNRFLSNWMFRLILGKEGKQDDTK